MKTKEHSELITYV